MKDRVPGAPGQYKALITAEELQKMQLGEQFAITMTRDDQPIVEGTPYSKAAVLPDAVAAQICSGIEDPTPADAFNGLFKHKTGFYKEVTGKDITIENAPESVLHGLKLYGWSRQDGAPTPENPVEIVTAGADGEIGVKVCGKNLANPADVYIQLEPSMASVGQVGTVITMTTSNYGEAFHFCKGALKAGKMYTISGNGANVGNIRIYDVTTPENFILRKNIELDSAGNFCCEFTPVTDNETVRVWINKGEIGELSNFQVEDGTKTDYEPYRGNTLTALTPNGLPGMKVSSGGTHTDGTGQQWICDEIDASRGVYLQRIGIRVYAGEEKILATGYPKAFTVEQLDCDYDKPILCSHFAFTNQYGGSKPGAGASSFSKSIVFNFSGTEIVTVEKNPAEAKAWFKAQHDNGTPVVVRYVLATPIERPLTKEEMMQYATLRTVSPSTHITNSDNVDMEVSHYLHNPAMPVSGGTMGGVLNMGHNRITGLRWPVAPTDAVSLEALQRSRDFEWEDVDNVTFNGWYLYSSHEEASKRITIDGYTFGYAYMFVERWNEESLRQTLYPVSATGYSLVRTRTVSGWTPWEWVNPPMIVDIEYRTTERWQGKPVYTKLINFGTLPNNSQKVVSAKLYSTASNMLRVSGTRSDGESLPMWFRDASGDKTVTLYSSRDNIVIITSYDCSMLTAYVQLWYVK